MHALCDTAHEAQPYGIALDPQPTTHNTHLYVTWMLDTCHLLHEVAAARAKVACLPACMVQGTRPVKVCVRDASSALLVEFGDGILRIWLQGEKTVRFSVALLAQG